ncbi:hypothetical protein CORC01_07530 [Colletotrichum orchidophilum]|uniref:Heterokaryon incompatibility domain-containing protein n=1 Tax=Colletotrichum orchidophilum TaxID=1209926 RepID=A0A1G4B6M1_9PEZI|nr:uncharacterized protein CORC01_07530 [Colletotrichum orchidophilum]OHE97089.1 hypothetical protein CORC01_07530 [Colletotrichum orchidophilum]
MSADKLPAYSPPTFVSTIYAPLVHPDAIRVLILYPAVRHDAEIQCRLLSTEISTCQELNESYVALSYVWGDLSDPQLVQVNGQGVYIGSNLSEALRHLRRRDRPIRLWADALCINQYDIAERNHQVHQMRNIYSSAFETIIYLGSDDGSNTTFSAWNFLERKSEWALDKNGNEDFKLPSALEENTIHFRGDLADVEISVLKQSWFLRVWVLQEVVVSRKVSVQCGHRRIPWNDFCKIILLNQRYHDRYGYSLRAADRVNIVRDMFQARCAYQESHDMAHLRPSWHTSVTNYGGRSAHIIDMLVRARQLEASDPRDKIFALLGISTSVDADNKLVAVDYDKPNAKVQADLARYMMEENMSFDMLSYVNHSVNVYSSLKGCDEAGTLPSWVPDWDGSQVARNLKLTKVTDDVEWEWEPLSGTATATNVICPTILSYLEEEEEEDRKRRQDISSKSMAWINDNMTLVLTGSIIGRIAQVGPAVKLRGRDELSFQAIRDRIDDRQEMRRAIIRRWTGFLVQRSRKNLDDTHNDPRSIVGPLPLIETALQSLDDDPDLGPHTIESHMFARGRQTAAWSGEGGQIINQVTDRTSTIENKRIGVFVSLIDPISEFRRIILPNGSKKDDLIVSIRGARVPFVVRVADGNAISQYELVGECLINEFRANFSQDNKWITMAFR